MDPEVFMAKMSMSFGYSAIAILNAKRPIRPNPLIAAFTTEVHFLSLFHGVGVDQFCHGIWIIAKIEYTGSGKVDVIRLRAI